MIKQRKNLIVFLISLFIIILILIIVILSYNEFFKTKQEEIKIKKPEIEKIIKQLEKSKEKIRETELIKLEKIVGEEKILSEQEKKELGISFDTEVKSKIISGGVDFLGPIRVISIKNQEQQILDQDKDGLSDEEEKKLGTNPNKRDTDVDGIDDKDEIELGIDPLKKDTDGDGVDDSHEIKTGIDPKIK